MSETRTLPFDALGELMERAALGAGAREEVARILANANLMAEAEGLAAVGVSHFLDYLASFGAGRIDGQAHPTIERPSPVVFRADANGGIAHTAWEHVAADLIVTTKAQGVAVFAQRGAYTCGQLGYYTDRLAREGLVGLATTNSPAFVAGSGTKVPVYGTDPMSFAAPMGDGGVLLIDQSSSATAFVSVRAAADRGESIPEGWAIDPEGRPTTDPHAAMAGALLPFGGARGANVAMMVEILSAGLTGANWGMDAPSIVEGDRHPGVGMVVIALEPGATGAEGLAGRVADWAGRMQALGGHIPGQRRAANVARARAEGLTLDAGLVAVLERYAAA